MTYLPDPTRYPALVLQLQYDAAQRADDNAEAERIGTAAALAFAERYGTEYGQTNDADAARYAREEVAELVEEVSKP